MARAILNVPSIQPFDITGDQTSLSKRWETWLKSFNYFVTGSGVTDKGQKRALLLHLLGTRVQEIFETLTDTGADNDYDRASTCLNTYFKPKANVPFERHVFRQSSQNLEETVDQYATRLKKLALTCEFEDKKDDMTRGQIIDKYKSNDLRRRFLREKDLPLEKLLDIGRSYEAADLRAKKMEHPEQEVNRVKSSGYTTKSHTKKKRPDKGNRLY